MAFVLFLPKGIWGTLLARLGARLAQGPAQGLGAERQPGGRPLAGLQVCQPFLKTHIATRRVHSETVVCHCVCP